MMQRTGSTPEPAVHTMTSGALAAALAARRLRCVDVVGAFLARIDALNPRLNALVEIARAQALATAENADAMLARGDVTGPLHGLPFTVKDVFDVAGLRTAAGMPERRNHVATADASVVARLKAAGAIVLGKSNCPPGGAGGNTDNPLHGPTRNPHHLAHSAGGSSGGEAAAVAASFSTFGLGSDSGGSLRVPAHFCGVATLKPTVGRIPNTGVLNHPGGLSDPRTQIGVLARSVADIALVWPLLSGPDGHDSGVVPMPRGAATATELRSMRVALFLDDGRASPTPETRAAVQAAADALAAAGVEVVAARPPALADAWPITQRYWAMDTLSGSEVQQLFADWDAYRTRLWSFLSGFDAIVCPVDAEPAPRRGHEHAHLFSYTLPFSLCGWPSVVVRAGTDPQGLPIGVQLTAAPWQEHTALALASAVEAAVGPWPEPAALHSH